MGDDGKGGGGSGGGSSRSVRLGAIGPGSSRSVGRPETKQRHGTLGPRPAGGTLGGGSPPRGPAPSPPRPGSGSTTGVGLSPGAPPTVDPRFARRLPGDFCKKNRVILLNENTLGMANPNDRALVQSVEQMISRRVSPVQMRPFDIEKALKSIFTEKVDVASADVRVVVRPLRKDSRAGAVDLASGVLGDALHHGATDIHFERFPDGVDIRYRVDGLMVAVSSPITPQIYSEVISRLKVLAELDVAEHRMAQDGRFTILASEGQEQRLVDVRVAILPGPDGEEAILRMLDPGRVILELGNLGMEPEDIKLLNQLILNPEGLIVVAGPTGSGKTTTLYSCLAELADGTRKVVTAEDPIEYRMARINQKQASSKASLADLARAFLRADPDVILIGEIRDDETALYAARAAQTGHLVFSTLHLNQALNAPNRLRTLGLPDETIGQTLLCVVAQRLIRKVCENCKESYTPEPEFIELIPGAERIQEFWHGRGCAKCKDTGFKGRIGLYELMYCDEEVGGLIQAGEPRHKVKAALKRRGHRTMRQDALRKLARGMTTLEEVYRVVPKRVLDDL